MRESLPFQVTALCCSNRRHTGREEGAELLERQLRSGDNHRGSVFRLIVGTALIGRDGHKFLTWADGNAAAKDIREAEVELERAVSSVIRNMPFLWLDIGDEPGPGSMRGKIERNAIALLSNFNRPPLDRPSPDWLGHHCDHKRDRVRVSGIWNQNHVDDRYDPKFLDGLEQLVERVNR
jgi:hypothetical protein